MHDLNENYEFCWVQNSKERMELKEFSKSLYTSEKKIDPLRLINLWQLIENLLL